MLDAWALDRSALRIREVNTRGVECLNDHRRGSFVPSAPRALRATALTFRPAPGLARIYAYLSWPDFPLESAIGKVSVDSQMVGRVEGGSFLMVDIEPGRHRVSVPGGRNEAAIWLDTMPDSSYFVELRRKTFAWSLSWAGTVRRMDPVRARAAIRKAHMVSSSWPGTPLAIAK